MSNRVTERVSCEVCHTPLNRSRNFRARDPRCLLIASVTIVLVTIASSCDRAADRQEVVAYVALDAEFSESILAAFERQNEIDVRPVFDIESTKTVGLVNRLIAERNRTRCDLFWNNEILHTIRLQKLGLLQPFDPPPGFDVPASFRDPQGRWYGFAARARVLLVNKKLREETEPTSILDLADAERQHRGGMARPLFGTTATHAAVLFAIWGEDRAINYYRNVRDNSRIYSGNRQVAEAVARGEIDFGITDTDDAIIQIEKGAAVQIVFPDQGEGEIGTLFIPNTVCILKGAPHPAAARKLAGYILSAQVEAKLARGRSAQIPLRKDVKTRSRVSRHDVRPMEVDFAAAADAWDAAAEKLEALFR